MLKKFIILSLVLFLAGAAGFGWVLAEQRKKERLQQEQQEILNARLDRLDKLVSGGTDVYPFTGIVSDEDSQQKLEKYKMRKETRELTLTASTVCMLTGGTIFTWWLLLWTARLLIRGFSDLMKFSAGVLKRSREITDEQPTEAGAKGDEKASAHAQKPRRQQGKLKGRSEALVDLRWQNFNKNYTAWHEHVPSRKDTSMRKQSPLSRSAPSAEETAVPACDKKSAKSAKPLKATTKNLNANKKQSNQSAQSSAQTRLSDSQNKSAEPEDSLKTQIENLEEQMVEFKQMTELGLCNKSQNGEAPETVQQALLERSEPLNDTLTELTQQVAAIREYASQQQDKVEKLQDGYDWNIVKNFCLRVIRCIDNLENRINRLSQQGAETTDLEEIRDELVFALESSGVEQFEPEINSDYRGQEKNTEAVKDKECPDGANLTGKIAKVIKPGYQYVIDEENVKVVRAAQVKLFG